MEMAILPQLREPARPAAGRAVPQRSRARALGQGGTTAALRDGQTSRLDAAVRDAAPRTCFYGRIINSRRLTLFYFHPVTDILSELHHTPQIAYLFWLLMLSIPSPLV